ncbi:MAG: General secretion pathway protein GspF [Actinobacteria bacterium]|nr:General secretion pathway protein GspF [Actinomycetota bacterium]MBM2827775.1 General secretion pathway protein GspF [Actinomycetota bacterium]
MAVFGYRAADREGRVSEGMVEAAEERGAAEQLREMGYLPIRVWSAAVPGAKTAAAAPRGTRKGGTKRDILPFLQGLRTLLVAGVPLDRSLGMLADLFRGKPMGESAGEILREVRAGSSLAEAMKKASGAPFDRFTVQMVSAGAATGRMEEALGQVCLFLQRSRDFRASLQGSLLYPAVLLVASILSVVLLLVFVVPRFVAVFAASRIALPLPTRILLSLSTFLKEQGLYLLLAGVFLYYLASAALKRPEARRDWDRSKLRLPGVGGIFTAIETSRILRSLSSLLSGGVPILSAFMIAREVSGNLAIREGMEAARLRVQGGVKVARALAETTPVPELALQMIAVGEETGRLEEMLSSVADTYEENARRSLQRFLVLLEPTVILAMGLLVGFIVFSMFLAIFRLNEVPL